MQHDLLFLWPFLSLLQVCIVGGASSVLNGAVGESIVLPAGVDGTVQAKLLQWSENNKVIIQSAKKRVQVLDQRLEGRATMSNETGDLTISSLREEDSGKYVFNGVGSPSSESILPKEVELHVYERISKVQVTSVWFLYLQRGSLRCREDLLGAGKECLVLSTYREDLLGAERISKVQVKSVWFLYLQRGSLRISKVQVKRVWFLYLQRGSLRCRISKVQVKSVWFLYLQKGSLMCRISKVQIKSVWFLYLQRASLRCREDLLGAERISKVQVKSVWFLYLQRGSLRCRISKVQVKSVWFLYLQRGSLRCR
ncbi:hypothetical protein JZ751_016666 [Albula glossodonta]|uniref:Immunoglobulin domain-containing protein n=1 Tax=Albula glossodonta TaxID=121402 RepID=A0A8T2MKR4_9TELE|nr:hypothetical protein JZ751_016666 [Albula glossodonta]